MLCFPLWHLGLSTVCDEEEFDSNENEGDIFDCLNFALRVLIPLFGKFN